MKRRVRRLSRLLERKYDEMKSITINFGRSNSDYHYPQRNNRVISTLSPSLSDTEDDLVFEGTAPDESRTNDARRGSLTLIPCEFCHVQQSSEDIIRHQHGCSQNPTYSGRRRNLTTNITTEGSRRRAISDNVTAPPAVLRRVRSPTPSAPPRSRSPSPTEGFTVPTDLICPITHSIFRDPVVASDGHTYERSAITDCLRASQKSPLTRQNISLTGLNPNRIVKKLADDFRAECQRKRALYKYKLNVDVKKLEELIDLKTNTKIVYQAEWIKKNSSLADSKIILTHLIGDNAEQLADISCRLGPHPNIIRTFGRVEHDDAGILLLQESLPQQTLSQLLKTTEQQFSIPILDTIVYQIAFALQHLVYNEILRGNITADNVFVCQFDDNPENILVKLSSEIDITSEVSSSNELPSEKSDVFAFGELVRDLYRLEVETSDEDLIQRQKLFDSCLATDPNARPTFNELTKAIADLIQTKKFLF